MIFKDSFLKTFKMFGKKDINGIVESSEIDKTKIISSQILSNDNISISTKESQTSVFSCFCVCLDPGHSKKTKGKRSPYSLNKQATPVLPLEEWQFNREIVSLLKQRLLSLGFTVFITTDSERDGDKDIALSTRAARANDFVKQNNKTGIFISIHADADGNGSRWTTANGWSAYTTKGQNNSDILAEYLYNAADEIFTPKGLRLRRDYSDKDSDKEKNFTVIYKANMPAVLTENFFYTNISDTEFISSDEGKQLIVDVHEKGIVDFVQDKYLNIK